ncbi:MAG TPA: hypothetical protein VFX11_03785 [Candidatus Kapabacteria bacterium]|nr:hypothetical protein [Candidatus Kapabacteria bacterium]
MKLLSGFVMALVAFPVMAADLRPLDDGELAGVSGGDGIAIGWEYGVNTDTSGAPLATLGSCAGSGTVTATGGDRCRFAWQVAKRTGNGNAAWTVAKNGWLSVKIPALNIDVQATMGGAGGVGANNTYFDNDRFMGYDNLGASVCLLPGGGASCAYATIDTLPAIKLYYPVASYNATTYTPGTGVSTGFTSLQIGLNIGRMSIEYDTCTALTNCTSASPGYVPGYLRDANAGSFLGTQIRDNNGNFAMMAIGGSALIYGF